MGRGTRAPLPGNRQPPTTDAPVQRHNPFNSHFQEDEQVILDVQEDNTYEEKPKAPQRMPAARPPPLPKNEAPKPLKVNNPFGVPEQKLENVSLDSPAKVPNGSGPFADDPPLLEGKFYFVQLTNFRLGYRHKQN